jgi:hypothetical protein
MNYQPMSNPVKHFIDGAGVATVALNIAGVISGVAAALAGVLTVAWAVLRLYEMQTVQLLLPERLRLPQYRTK